MADLHWFPFFAKDWLSSPSVQRMTPEQRGAYIQLLAIAWGNGESEPCLPDAADALAQLSGLGRRWEKVGALVRDQFDHRGTFLFNSKLTVVWKLSTAKHDKAVERARKAGRASGQRRANPKPTPSSTPSEHGGNHAGMDMVTESSKDSLSRGAGALAPSEARPAPAVEAKRNGDGPALLSDKSPTDILRMAGVTR